MSPEESTEQFRVLTAALLSTVKSSTKMHRIRQSFDYSIETFYEYAMAYTGWDRREIELAFFERGMPRTFPTLYQTPVRARELLLLPSELGVTPMEALPWAKLFLDRKGNAYNVPKSSSLLAARFFHREGVSVEYLATAYFEPSFRPQHEILVQAYHGGIPPEYTTELLASWSQR